MRAVSRDVPRLPDRLHRQVGSPLQHLHHGWARPCHICTGTGLASATSAPRLGSPLPHPHRNLSILCSSNNLNRSWLFDRFLTKMVQRVRAPY